MSRILHFSVCSLSLVMTFIPMTSVIFMLVIPKPLSLAHILCRDLNYPKPGWLWNISAWYILKVKVKLTQSCPTHFYLVRLEKPESQHVQKELIFYFSLLLISNQLLSPLFYFVFLREFPGGPVVLHTFTTGSRSLIPGWGTKILQAKWLDQKTPHFFCLFLASLHSLRDFSSPTR